MHQNFIKSSKNSKKKQIETYNYESCVLTKCFFWFKLNGWTNFFQSLKICNFGENNKYMF